MFLVAAASNGQTDKYLETRLSQHKRDVRDKKETSALSQHSLQLGHTMDFDNTKILYKKQLLRERLFFEMVGIVKNLLSGFTLAYSN